MGYCHDLIVVQRDDLAAVVEDSAHALRPSCIQDVGIETENIANLISVLRGVDIYDCLEDLLDEIEADHFETNDDTGAFGTALSDSIRDELAEFQETRIAEVLPKWLTIEGKYGLFGSYDPEQSLRKLVSQCRLAKSLGNSVVIKSYE